MMFADNPVLDPAQDKFNRLPFSQRIAEVIASRHDPSSLVIGIYGAWGEGKTTVFNFIEKKLETHSDIICVRYNPWFFGDEEKLLLSFFKTLADALNRKLTSRAQDIGGWLAKCGEILAPLSLADPTGSVRGSGQIFSKLGNLFSQVEIEENKERIEKILDEEDKRVVIFIDDIDRLENSEIQSILKLVKLTAGFKNTVYLLALDNEKVAAAIAEKYDLRDLDAGRSFLEKIIQVPLPLPQASFSSLQNFCYECVNEALKNANLELTEEDIARFVQYFSEGLAIRLKTPRVAQRYGNIVAFSVPLLKGEVNIVDLLLIEGVKVFYPKLYASIKAKPSYFLCDILDRGTNSEQVTKAIRNFIDQSIADLSQEDQFSARNLLQELFPKLTGILGKVHHGSDWQERWTKEKRIASIQYFKRYFAYGIPEDDVSDQMLTLFLNNLDTSSVTNICNDIKEITNNQNSKIESFITAIFRNIHQLPPSNSQNLALALAQMGDYFPRPKSPFPANTPFSSAGILIKNLIKRLETLNSKFKLCEELLQIAEPIPFAIECFRWIRIMKKEEEDKESLFSESEFMALAKVLVDRVRDTAKREDICTTFPDSAREFFDFWAYWSSRKETNDYLEKFFEDNPYNSVKFLKCYIPTVWSMKIGSSNRMSLPFKGDLNREIYHAITTVVDPELLVQYLREIDGNKLDTSDFPRQRDEQLSEEVAARQFIYIHQKVFRETNNTNLNSSK